MKKASLLSQLVALFFALSSYGQSVQVVNVQNFQFSPANFTAAVGDIVRFTWVNGTHTTTSVTVPTGAAAWDEPITAGNTVFDYVITAPGDYSYLCIPHQPEMVGSFTVSAVTPVKLVNFSASVSDKTILLSWKTVTESNADYFSVQQAFDGKDFSELGRVKAAGNSDDERLYSFTVTKPDAGKRFVYFRLVTVDLDKKQQYSPIILHRQHLKGKNGKLITKLFPNPAKNGDHLQLSYDSDKSGTMQVSVYDASGKLVTSVPMAAVEGVNHTHLPLPHLHPGKYTLHFMLNGTTESHSLVVR
jgi:plastocyanin